MHLTGKEWEEGRGLPPFANGEQCYFCLPDPSMSIGRAWGIAHISPTDLSPKHLISCMLMIMPRVFSFSAWQGSQSSSWRPLTTISQTGRRDERCKLMCKVGVCPCWLLLERWEGAKALFSCVYFIRGIGMPLGLAPLVGVPDGQ